MWRWKEGWILSVKEGKMLDFNYEGGKRADLEGVWVEKC